MMQTNLAMLRCLECKKPHSFPLCPSCIKLIHKVNNPCCLCGVQQDPLANTICPSCERWPPNHRLICPNFYHGTMRNIIHQIKYHHQLHWLHVIASQLQQALLQSPWALPEALAPVPLHLTRLRERGFNQAFLIAKMIGASLGIPTKLILSRQKNTMPMHTFGRKQREKTLHNAFCCSPCHLNHIAIVDDIITTGSTFQACAQAMQKTNPHMKISFVAACQTRIKPR